MNATTKKLTGKVALVTGASKGIGASIATHLAAEGASVVVNYATSRDGADRVVREIVAGGGKAVAVQADVARKADVERLFAETRKSFGRLDVLVNNAGVYEFAPLSETTEELYRRTFDVNVLGVLLASKEALKYFDPAAGGSIINISSVVTTANPPYSSVYTATKGALDSITRVLANELGPRKVRVNAINPGMVETEGFHAAGLAGSDFQKQVEAKAPLGRIGQPRDIGPAAVFLASEDAAYITGETLRVSGGLT
jgi:3-oxoacyl-[acyl-carrier protein] reductase